MITLYGIANCDRVRKARKWLEAQGVPFDASACPLKTSYPSNNYYFYYSGNESFRPYSDGAIPAARGHRAHGPGVSGAALFGGAVSPSIAGLIAHVSLRGIYWVDAALYLVVAAILVRMRPGPADEASPIAPA